MRLIPASLLASLVAGSLFAQGGPWQNLPAVDGAPAIQYRLTEEGQGLRLEVKPGALDTTKWALHLWIGDPRMVEARKKHLQEIHAAIAGVGALLKDPDRQMDDCQENIRRFLEKAREAQLCFRDYDPYEHVQLAVGRPGKMAAHLRQIPLSAAQGEPSTLSAEVPFDGGFDAAAGTLDSLSLGLCLVARSNKALVALKSPFGVALKSPWRLDPFLAPGMERVPRFTLSIAKEAVLLHSHSGYRPGSLEEAIEGGCYGADGLWKAPEPWMPWADSGEVKLDSRSERLRFSFVRGHGSHLIVQPVKGGDFSVIELSLASAGEQGIELLDSGETPAATYLLLSVTGESRPDGGSGMCGAGEETNLIWLQLGADGLVKSQQSFLIESCLGGIASELKQPENGPWAWEWDYQPIGRHHPTGEHHTLQYDRTHPEMGLVDKVEPLAKR